MSSKISMAGMMIFILEARNQYSWHQEHITALFKNQLSYSGVELSSDKKTAVKIPPPFKLRLISINCILTYSHRQIYSCRTGQQYVVHGLKSSVFPHRGYEERVQNNN